MKYFLIIVLLCFITITVFSDTLEMINIGINDTLQMEYVIIDGSLLIKNSNVIFKIERDYEFKNGKIRFNIESDSLIMIYKPIKPKIKYRNFIYKKVEKKAINDSILFNDDLKISGNDNIYFGGIKGFMVNVGNSGNVTMNQTLELNIEGNVSDRWMLSGYIYDDGTQGVLNTYNIPVSQIENVNISIYDSLNMFSLGNNTFTGYQGKFTMRNREILGIYGIVKKGQLGFKGAIAGQKGQFRQIEFYCYDNVQGPYLLVEEITLAEYIIAPGSEKIFINGERLIEGDDNDYTINYQNGELYFTTKRIVDSNTLIYVEFQTYEGSHPITGYYGGFSAMDSIINIIYIREEQTIVDENDREIFETINSDSSKVFLSSIEFAGDNLGDYFYTDSILVFAGINSG
ncbi:hypothetical protein KAU15_06125, partial [candidate division WOR-3 bacterium]|nr:hypothetical protein [candidate division WOR-3 bacterium]